MQHEDYLLPGILNMAQYRRKLKRVERMLIKHARRIEYYRRKKDRLEQQLFQHNLSS